jgi:hypothetical protein
MTEADLNRKRPSDLVDLSQVDPAASLASAQGNLLALPPPQIPTSPSSKKDLKWIRAAVDKSTTPNTSAPGKGNEAKLASP